MSGDTEDQNEMRKEKNGNNVEVSAVSNPPAKNTWNPLYTNEWMERSDEGRDRQS